MLMKLAAAAGVSVIAAIPVQAADSESVSGDGRWTLTVAPYLWAAGLDGDVGLFGRGPVEIHEGFSEILDDLKFAAMGAVELHNGSWGVLADVMYVHVQPDENIERTLGGIPLALEATVDSESLAATFMGQYRVVSSDDMTLDLMAGVRIWDVNNDISARLLATGVEVAAFSGSDGSTWADPMIGVKTRINTDSPVYLQGWAMAGGAGVGSDFTWDLLGGIGYQWTDRFSTVIGYRAMGVDYENDGFVYDVVQHGVIAGAVLKF